MANWLEYINNPRGHTLKKTMFEVLKERYSKNEQIIERIGVSLIIEKDINDFMKLVSDIYETAYLKAVEDHKEELKKVGLIARVASPKNL